MVIDRDNIKILLILLIVGLGLGYAYINSDLNINGTAQVNSANWDVHWANIQVTNGSVSGSSVVTQPTISNQTTVNYSINLTNPGDYYEFTVDAVNGGSLDAMIDTIDSKLNGSTITSLPAYLKYNVTYSSGATLQPNQELLANTTETYKVRVEYRDDINANQLPSTNRTLNLQFTVTYRQANENAIKMRVTKYTANIYDTSKPNNNRIQIGQAIPSGITQYDTGAEALAALRAAFGNDNIQFYLKHTLHGEIVIESYVEFIVTEAMVTANPGMTAGTYALRGFVTYDENAVSTNHCQAQYYDSINDICLSPYHESNQATLLSAYGSTYCPAGYAPNTFCMGSSMNASSRTDGDVYAQIGLWFCDVGGGGKGFSDCSYGG